MAPGLLQWLLISLLSCLRSRRAAAAGDAAARLPNATGPSAGAAAHIVFMRPVRLGEPDPAKLGPDQGQSEAIPHGSPSFRLRGQG
jgi:hypothetical protein